MPAEPAPTPVTTVKQRQLKINISDAATLCVQADGLLSWRLKRLKLRLLSWRVKHHLPRQLPKISNPSIDVACGCHKGY